MCPHTWGMVSDPARKRLKYSDSRNGLRASSSVFTASNQRDTSAASRAVVMASSR